MKTRDEILKTIQQHEGPIHRFGVRKLGLFGSGARNETKEGSDLDFVVTFEKKTFDAYMDLKAYLEKLFNCSVDLVTEEAIKPRLRPYILKEIVHAPGL